MTTSETVDWASVVAEAPEDARKILVQLRVEYWPVSRLNPYPTNPKKHTPLDIERMATAIRTYGFRIPLLARGDGEIIDGHLRLKAALSLCLQVVPVTPADDMTEAEVMAFRLAVYASAHWAALDMDLATIELSKLRDLGFDTALTGLEDDLLIKLSPLTPSTGLTDEDAIPEPPEDATTQPGDLWILGSHRLLCGDSMNRAHVRRLIGCLNVSMAFTDPPYNVDYGNSAKDKERGNDRRILNDNLGEAFGPFLLAACKNLLEVTDGAVYICMSSSELDRLQQAFRQAGGHFSTFVIWAKNTFTLGRSDYQRQYEPILYGWRDGSERYWNGARDQSDVWECAKPRVNDLHPTMKPIELVERALQNSSRPGDLVADLFGGSGSTLIGCERLSRAARVMEIDELYCDVIVTRWQNFTGNKAVLDGDGRSFDELAAERKPESEVDVDG